MKTKLFILFIVIFSNLIIGFAQEPEEDDFDVEDDVPEIGSYNLKTCVEYAIQHSEMLKRARLDVIDAKAQVGENIARGLPQVNASASYRDNFEIPVNFFPSEFIPNAPPGEFVAVQAQPKYSGDMNITLSQLIFDFSYLIGLKAAREYEELQSQRVELSKIDVAERVAKAYYGVLVSRERIALLEQNYARLDTLLRETKALFESGFAENIDVMRTEVALNNIKVEWDKALGGAVLAEKLLKYQMGLAMRDSLILDGSIKDIQLNKTSLEGESNHKSRLEYDILERQLNLQYTNLKYNKSLYYPSLSGIVQYGRNTGTNNFGDYWRFRERWFGYGNYGITLNIPILDGFKRKHTLQRMQVSIERVELDLQEFERTVDFQVDQAKILLSEKLLNLESQKRNMELAKEVSRVAQIKYQSGVGSNLEIIDAETSYKEAETNYYVALYEAITNKIDLDKALGRLMEGLE